MNLDKCAAIESSSLESQELIFLTPPPPPSFPYLVSDSPHTLILKVC